MGQAFCAVALKSNWKNEKKPVAAAVYPHSYGSGYKMYEHFFVGNEFVHAAMMMIAKLDKKGKGVPFTWAAEYAEKTNFYDKGNDWMFTRASKGKKQYATLKKELAEEPYNCMELPLYPPTETPLQVGPKYLINRTKGVYVEVPEFSKEVSTIHPLPVLTAEFTDGGADYEASQGENGKNMRLFGAWAFDNISVSDDPKDLKYLERINWVREYEE